MKIFIFLLSSLIIYSQFIFGQNYVLVHGWMNNGGIFTNTDVKQLIQNEFGYSYIYQPNLNGSQTAATQSLNLRNYLNQYNINSGIAISYSMGGVTTRTHLKRQFDNNLSQRINQHYTIGSPHLGSKVANNRPEAIKTLILGAYSIVAPTGILMDHPIQGLGFTYETGRYEQYWVTASLLWGGSLLSDAIVSGLLDSPGFNDLKTNSQAIANINQQTNYENNTIKVGIAATEQDPILFRMLAHSDPIDISENLMLDYLEIIEYTKLARIAWALYYYFDDPTIYNFIWLARNVSAYAIFVNIDERWNNSVVEATQSDGLVSKFSQQYPNANSLYFPDDASHMEQLDNNQVVDALRSALNQYGNGPLVAPVIASITQNPVPIYKGTGGYVYANLSQGNGTINYNWFSTNQPSYVSINPNGSSCQITYLNVVESIPGDAPTWDFGCTVTNPAFPGWSSTMRFSPSLNSDPNGCPTLAFDNRGTLISENPLLITSMSNPGKDVTDYYLINTPLAPVNNKINVTIHEPQTEHTWFDNFSLLETRANPDETIVVNDEGQVINYKGVLPARILLNGETDITSNLLELDSLSVELNPGDKLTISRNAVEGDGDVVLGGEEPIIVKDRPSLIMNILTESKVEDSEEIKTESIPITNFFLRPNKSIISKRLRNLPTGTIEITVNKKLTLDYFVFVSDLRTARTRELPLVSAVHNVNGDVKTKLTGIDQNYSEMYPTQRIDLSFSTTINSGNRAYILKTVGRYETDTTFLAKQNNLAKLNEQPIIPTENKLYDNYPNPFNPSTIIKYSLKDGGRVSLKIFNSLGEEVRTLVNETEAAGIYEVEFNASNLPSGVYIYQLTTPGFTQARKMILAK